MQWNLTADYGIRAHAEPGTVPLRWSMAEYTAGTLPPVWLSDPLAGDTILEAGNLTLSFVAPQGAVTLAARPEFTAWFGVEDRFVTHLFFDGPAALAPGEVAQVAAQLSLPPGGLLVAAGERVALRVASYMADAEPAAAIELVVGQPATPSGMTLVLRETVLPPYQEVEAVSEQGSFQGSLCAIGDPTDTATVEIPLEIPEDALGVRVDLRRAGGTGPPDLDFELLDEAGQVVGAGEGSGGDEGLILGPANLDAIGRGAWTLFVFSCQPQVVDYHAHVWLLMPDEAA